MTRGYKNESEPGLCVVEGCSRLGSPRKIAQGQYLCSAHFQRLRKYGDVMAEYEYSAICIRCGRKAYNEQYFATLPSGETMYWMDFNEHEYQRGDIIDPADERMVCPFCFTPEEKDEMMTAMAAETRCFRGLALAANEARRLARRAGAHGNLIPG
jgi:hypothetical protein